MFFLVLIAEVVHVSMCLHSDDIYLLKKRGSHSKQIPETLKGGIFVMSIDSDIGV